MMLNREQTTHPKMCMCPPDEPFEGKTHYNSMYRWVYLPKRDNFKLEEVVYRSEMPFDDTTSYKTQFPKHDVEPRKDYTPQKKCMCHQMSPSRVKHTITVISGGCICQRERTSNPKKLSIDQKCRLMVQHITKHSFLNMMLNHAKTTPQRCVNPIR